MTDLVVAPRPRSTVVPPDEWLLMSKQAELLASSDIIPAAYRHKPANIMVAALTGRSHGWDVMTSMRNGHVVEGTWGLRPEAMLGLVRRAGHSVTAVMDATGAKVTGTRADSGDVMTVEWTLEDARRARLAEKSVWKAYPQAMCYWRAVGMLCRFLFSDVTLGLMSAEELGAGFDPDGELIEAEVVEPPTPNEPVLLSQEAIAKFVEACETEGLDPSGVMRRAFPDHQPDDPLTDHDLPRLRDVFRQMVEEVAALRNGESPEPGADVPPEPHEADGIDAPPPDIRPATRNQVGKIKGEYERLGVEDRDEQLRYTSAVVAHDIGSHNELNRDEAARLIDYLVGTESFE